MEFKKKSVCWGAKAFRSQLMDFFFTCALPSLSENPLCQDVVRAALTGARGRAPSGHWLRLCSLSSAETPTVPPAGATSTCEPIGTGMGRRRTYAFAGRTQTWSCMSHSISSRYPQAVALTMPNKAPCSETQHAS